MIRFVRATATCPHCSVQKHQIDTSEEHAAEVVNAAIEQHVAKVHPSEVQS